MSFMAIDLIPYWMIIVFFFWFRFRQNHTIFSTSETTNRTQNVASLQSQAQIVINLTRRHWLFYKIPKETINCTASYRIGYLNHWNSFQCLSNVEFELSMKIKSQWIPLSVLLVHCFYSCNYRKKMFVFYIECIGVCA